MHKNLLGAIAIVLASASLSAYADDHCTFEPRSKWLTSDAIKAKVEQKGYTVQRIDTDDGCYEIHATGKNGERIELTMHPLTGAVVEENIKYPR